VWAAVGSYAVAIAIQWVGRPQFSAQNDDTTWLILESMLGQIAFWLGNLFAGGAVLLAVLRADRADLYELDNPEPVEPDDAEPDGPFAGMVD
jgi:hypothetical protein